VTLSAAVVVLASTGLRLAERAAGPVPGWARERATATVVGQVAGDPSRLQEPGPDGQERWAVRLRAPTVKARGGVARAGGPVLVLGGPSWGAAVAGSWVRAGGRFLPPRPADPAVAAMIASRPPVAVGTAPWPWRAAERLRAGLREACEGLAPDAGGLLPALVVGDTSRLPADLTADLRAAGLTHLTAVSGANVAIVGAFVAVAAAYLGAGRSVRTVVTGAAVAGFVVLARPEPSVLRAAVMGAVGLVGAVVARAGSGVPALSAATIALLVLDPWLARSFGFVLSVVATAGLLLLVPVWLHRWHLPRPVAVALAVPLAAQAATAPVVVLLQPQISLVGVPANVLAAPAVAPATVAGVVAAGLSPLWPAGAHVVAMAGGIATSWIAAVAHTAADVPGGAVPWLPGRAGAALLALLTAAVILGSTGRWPGISGAVTGVCRRAGGRLIGGPGARRAGGWPPVRGSPVRGSPTVSEPPAAHPNAPPGGGRRGPPGWTGRRPAWSLAEARRRVPSRTALVVAIVLAVAGWLVADRWWPGPLLGAGPREDWALVQCDVGQGDALLLRSGSRRAVLVDTGPEPGAVHRCLRRWRVERLDLVVITHFHADHAGGLAGALRGRGRPPVIVSPCSRPRDQARQARSAAARAGVQLRQGGTGLAGRLEDDAWPVRWQIVWPGDRAATAAADHSCRSTGEEEGSDINDASVVLVAEVRGIRVVALGDVELDAQRALTGRLGDLRDVDVVKVAHHGSARQHPPLYASLRARVALIGVGAENDYGHPTRSALRMLAGSGTRVLRTDRHGDLAVVGSPGRLAVWTDRRTEDAGGEG
jgi:competence protein ComEC